MREGWIRSSNVRLSHTVLVCIGGMEDEGGNCAGHAASLELVSGLAMIPPASWRPEWTG